MEKILVAMSGGVDSSVTAKLLLNKGYDCSGSIMLLDAKEKDIEDAKEVANKLGIDFHIFDCREEFKNKVIFPFISSYLDAKTPNPCIECNKYLKFGKFFEEGKKLGFEKIATGHYARITFENGKWKLKKALDNSKDQSYFLYFLNQKLLSKIILPLGEMTKIDARSIAETEGFINAHKSDSQDICFVPDGDYAKVIEDYVNQSVNSSIKLPSSSGDFISKDGTVLGKHKGIIHYTSGQRKGLGISAKASLYVVKIDSVDNTVILGDNDDLFCKTVKIKDFNWIDGNDEIPTDFTCKARIRYRHIEQPCNVHYNGDGTATITFLEAQRAITPGQTAVLYDNDTVLGGGEII